VTVTSADVDARRGAALRVVGMVRAEGERCAHVPVEVLLRAVGRRAFVSLGTLATDGSGGFAGSLVVPSGTKLGDHDVLARTPGDSRCGKGGP
jgi:hypothetical protein